jgi:hypothetical protein
MQLRFTSFAVINLRRDLHPQECAHAGRTSGRRRGCPRRPPTAPDVRITYPALPVDVRPRQSSVLSLFRSSCRLSAKRHRNRPRNFRSLQLWLSAVGLSPTLLPCPLREHA